MWITTLLAVGAGFVVGRMAPGGFSEAGGNEWRVRTAGGVRSSGMEYSTTTKAPQRTRAFERRQEGSMVRFSLKQWRMLQEKPDLLRIDLGECLRGERKVEVPVEEVEGFGIVGYRIERVEGGPDLTKVAEFFGLDETGTEKLGESVMRYAARLRELERQNEHAEYSGDGGMVVRFPGTGGEKRKMLKTLRDEVSEAMGKRNADRFWELSEIGDSWTESDIRLMVSVNDKWASIKLSDGRELIFPTDNSSGSDLDSIVRNHFGEWDRISHLQHKIDWKRLVKEATSKDSAR